MELWDIYQLAGGAGQRGKNGSGSPSRLGGVPWGLSEHARTDTQSERIYSSEPSSLVGPCGRDYGGGATLRWWVESWNPTSAATWLAQRQGLHLPLPKFLHL